MFNNFLRKQERITKKYSQSKWETERLREMKNMHSLIHFICNSIPVVLIVVVAVSIVLHKWKLIRENVMFSVFYLQWRTAKIECKSNRIELPEKPHRTRDSKGRRTARESEWDSALLCEWDASRMCTIQTSTRCNSEKLPDAMKNLWKNVQLSRSTTTKARTLKAAHAHSHSHPHIRAHIRTRSGARGAERATKTSVENRTDWASFALSSYTSSSLSPASAIASMCASRTNTSEKKQRETDSWCFSHLFAVFFYALLGLSSLPGGWGEQHPATADEGESEKHALQQSHCW